MSEVLLQRTPVVRRNQEVVGYELNLLTTNGTLAKSSGLTALLAGHNSSRDFFERLPNRFALVDAEQVKLESEPAAAGRVVLGLRAEATTDLGDLIKQCKSAGLSVCALDPQNSAWTGELLDQASHFRLAFNRLEGKLAESSKQLRRHDAKQIAADLHTHAQFDAAQQAGCDLFCGYFFLEPAQSDGQKINPTYSTIASLMKLVQDNAPLPKIDELLKRDAALSYKLLRYINSAGFGLSCEITSFRHAVTVLGYQNLHRWLALLLVTAAKQSGSAALVGAAVARGRLAELLGHGLFEAKERDNLFIVGAFSLLHAILGMPLDKIAETIILPEALTDALTTRQGPYGPILRLIELLERLDLPKVPAQARDLAMSLGLSLDGLNRAQIDALIWAESLGV